MTELDGKVAFVTGASRGVGAAVARRLAETGAAVGPASRTEDDLGIERMIDVNLKGTLYTARATLPHLVAAGGGDFLSLASVAGLRGSPQEAGSGC